MKFKTLEEFIKQLESSPWTRTRQNALLGIGPDIPEAGLNSRSTADPRLVDYSKKRKKKKKKKKKISEAKEVSTNKAIDKWLNSVDGLKRDLDQIPDETDDEIPDSDLPDDSDTDDLDDDLDDKDLDDSEDEGEDEEMDAPEISGEGEPEDLDFGLDDDQVSPQKPVPPAPVKPAKSFRDWAKEKDNQQQ